MPVIGDRTCVSIATILLATDSSTASQHAEPYARSLAHYFSSKVVLLDVIDFSFMFSASPDGAAIDFSALEDAGRISLGKLEKKYAAAGVTALPTVLGGLHPATEILRSAKNEHADLIVMGTRGRSGVERMILGSTATEVMHLAHCPVLTVGPAVGAIPDGPLCFRSIVFATDLSPEASQTAVLALSFAQEFGAHIHLLHVLPNEKHTPAEQRALEFGFSAALRRMIPDVVREWCEPACTLEHGDAAAGILHFAQRVKADLIVLGAHKQADWFTEFRAGVAYEVAAKAGCPVLTLRR